MTSNELTHYGVLGMRWGVRRSKAQLARASSSRKRKIDDSHEDHKKAHDSKSVRSMSNQELKDRNNRLQMEQQYKKLTKKANKGSDILKGVIAAAGTITAAKGAYDVYKGLANGALDKIGDFIVKSIDLTKPFTS